MAANTKNGKYSLEMKRKVIAYYNENQVPKNIEDLLNRMYQENPSDIFGYMAEYFGKLSKPPKISRVDCREILSSRGYTSFIVELFCSINGIEKLVSSVVAPLDSNSGVAEQTKVKTPDPKAKTPEPQIGTTTGLDGCDNERDITEAIERIESVIFPALQGICPDKLQTTDGILSDLEEKGKSLLKASCSENEEQPEADGKPDVEVKNAVPEVAKKQNSVQPASKGQSATPKKDTAVVVPDLEEEQVFRDHALLTVSMVTALAGASLSNAPLYEYLSRTENQQMSEKISLPIPVMAVLTSGKWAAGKQNMVKEIMICPQPGVAITKGLQQLISIYHQLGNIVNTKGGALKCTTEDGSFSPSMDKPEQGLEYVMEAVSACGLTLGTDIHMIINFAATEFYDQEKQKYEVIANTFKSTDDLISMYCDFHERYPGVLAIIDGIRSADKEGWIKLNQRLGEKCFIIGNEIYRKHPSELTAGVKEKVSSGVVLSLDHDNTLTGVINKANTIHEQGGLVVMTSCLPEDTSSVVIDMAVSVGAHFIRLGGPVRSEHVAKYRRLGMIEEELEKNERLLPSRPHVFPVVNEPEPEENANKSS